MLLSSTRAARRVGASYICAKCLATSSPPSIQTTQVAHRAALIPHNDRSLSTTSPRATPAVEEQPTPAPDPPATLTPSESPQASPSTPPKKKKNKSKKSAAKKQDEVLPDAARQLHVLQGALAALKNVLAAQNIDVGNIGHIGQIANSKMTDSNKKPESQAKGDEGDSKEALAPPKAKKGSKKTAKGKDGSSKTPRSMGSQYLADLRKSLADADAAVSQASSESAASTAASQASAVADTSKRVARRARKTAKAVKATKATKATKKTRVRGRDDPLSLASVEKQLAKALPTEPIVDPLATSEDPTAPPGPLRVLPYSAIGSTNKIGLEPAPQPTVVGNPFSGEPFPKKLKSTTTTTKPKTRSKKSKDTPPLSISKINAKDLALAPIAAERVPVPSLSYGLERVLFNPGVYYLQEPRSRVFNFDPYLAKIMPLQEFDFNALKQYVTSSKDSNLISIAKDYKKKYTGSTSSMTSMLAHFHYLISSWRPINVQMLSRTIRPDSFQFTRINRAPATVFLNWKDGTYAIDADKEFDTANILSMLGKSMEKLLTLPKEDFERYRHINSDQITEEERNAAEAFHYTGFEDFMMRSQLDAYDPRVPGTGMFDLKTRAVVSIRMDAKGFEKGLGYEIRTRFGQWGSFEREYYDMMRSAFMKYSLQVRMGRMDGIFVAFHNTERIFGFQYIPLPEMDLSLHGTSNTTLGNREFKFSLSLLNKILDRATEKFPEQSLRLHFETRTSVGSPFMYVFAKPVTQEDIDEVQNASKASIAAFEEKVMGINRKAEQAEEAEEAEEAEQTEQVEQAEPAASYDEAIEEEEIEEKESPNESPKNQELQSLAAWEEVRQTVEEAMEDDEDGVGVVREAIEDALEESGLIRAKSSEEARGYVDALLAAITGHEHSRPVKSADSLATDILSADIIDEDAEEAAEAAAENSLHTDSEESGDAQPSEVVNEADSAAESVGEKEVNETIDSTTSQTLESTSHESEALSESQEASKDASGDVNSSALIDETIAQSQSQATTSSGAESEDVEQDEEPAAQEEEQDELDEDEDLDVTESKEDASTVSDMAPLKDLIVRMAQRIDEKPVSEEDSEDSLNDSSKLKAFERILGEMISRAEVLESKQQPSTLGSESSDVKEIPIDGPAKTTAESTDADDVPSSGSTKAAKGKKSRKPSEEEIVEEGELLGMVLTIKNKVNGKYVERPENLTKSDEWILEYNIEEIPEGRAHRFYHQCKARRRKALEDTGEKDTEWYKMFQGQLDNYTNQGRQFRAREEEIGPQFPVHVVGRDEPLAWHDVFSNDKDVAADAPLERDVQDLAMDDPVAEDDAMDNSDVKDGAIDKSQKTNFPSHEDEEL